MEGERETLAIWPALPTKKREEGKKSFLQLLAGRCVSRLAWRASAVQMDGGGDLAALRCDGWKREEGERRKKKKKKVLPPALPFDPGDEKEFISFFF